MKGPARLLIAAGLLLAAGCEMNFSDDRPPRPRPPAPPPTPEPKIVARWVTTKQAQELIRTRTDLFILCVAVKEEYDKGHLPNSVLIPVMALKDSVDRNTIYADINRGRVPDREQPVLVYCWWKKCGCPSIPTYSQLARSILIGKGFRWTYYINGGMPGWIKDKLPYEKTQKQPPSPNVGTTCPAAAKGG